MQPKQLRLAPPTPTLTDVQRWALELAEQHGWGVFVQAGDGRELRLRRGVPSRALVLYLSDGPEARAGSGAEAGATPQRAA